MLNRLAPPPARPLGRVDLPTAEVTHLSNGARLHVMKHHSQPVVRLQVVLPAGRWYDAPKGISLLTARALLEGTATRTARQIADEVAFYGASLECEQGFDRTTLTLYCLSRHLTRLLPLAQDVLLNATFPITEVKQIQTRTIQNIRVERQKTSYQAVERFSRNLYGAAHPYGSPFNETAFEQLTSEQAQQYHRQHYNLAHAEIFLCGDVSPEQVQSVSDTLSVSTADGLAQSAEHVKVAGELLIKDQVTVPDSLQASLRLGRLLPAATHPDNHRLQVLVKVLGGYFGSRLMKNIREDKGLTYGIYASISHREHASSLVIGSDVNAVNARLAINEINKELSRLQEVRIPVTELDTVRNYIMGKFLNELGTIFEQADKYKLIVLLGLPLNFYNHYLLEVSSVNSDDLLALAQQYLSPSDLIEVVAGP